MKKEKRLLPAVEVESRFNLAPGSVYLWVIA